MLISVYDQCESDPSVATVEKVAALAKDADVLIGVGCSFNIPSPAICDPELTMSLPPVVTAFTGMDALTHAIEGYVSRASDTFSEALAEKAIKLIAGALRRATFNGEHDRQARYDMMMGSTLAAMNFCNSILGISHSMAPPLGAYFHVPHGVGNAICLPVVMQFNMWAYPGKFAELARLFDRDITGMDLKDAAQLGVDCVRELLEDLPVPSLASYGITQADIPLLSDEAMKGGARCTNPKTTTTEDFHILFAEALKLKN